MIWGGKGQKKQYNESVTHWWDSNPSVAESYRIIETKVQLFNKNEEAQSILLTAAEEREENPIISANLAIAMAQSNKKTVLIDLNLRQPTII